jgi:hypothetical protein
MPIGPATDDDEQRDIFNQSICTARAPCFGARKQSLKRERARNKSLQCESHKQRKAWLGVCILPDLTTHTTLFPYSVRAGTITLKHSTYTIRGIHSRTSSIRQPAWNTQPMQSTACFFCFVPRRFHGSDYAHLCQRMRRP